MFPEGDEVVTGGISVSKVHAYIIGYSRETTKLIETLIEEHSFLKRKLDEGRKGSVHPGDGDGLTVSV